MSADVELDHVTIRFGEFTAVQNANLKIEDGEFFSFLGPSGCGKTTILRAVSGFLEPSEGAVRIGGRGMRGIGPKKRTTALIFPNRSEERRVGKTVCSTVRFRWSAYS